MPAKKVAPKKMGRPPIYTQAIANRICERIADGESLRAICADTDMPSRFAVRAWLISRPDFASHYARAREEQADADADAITDLTHKVIAGDLDPQAARVAIDALKWAAGKRAPKKYGDKLELNQTLEIVDPQERLARIGELLGRIGSASPELQAIGRNASQPRQNSNQGANEP
jgi:hypothetical protein